jgi:hypothetical protein
MCLTNPKRMQNSIRAAVNLWTCDGNSRLPCAKAVWPVALLLGLAQRNGAVRRIQQYQ